MASKKKATEDRKSTAKKATRSVQTASRKQAAKKKTATEKKAAKKPVAKKKTATASKPVVKKKATSADEKEKEKNKKMVTVKKITTATKKATTPSGQQANTAKKANANAKKVEATDHIAKPTSLKANADHNHKEISGKSIVNNTAKKEKANNAHKSTINKSGSGKPKFVYKPEPSILDIPKENNGPRRRYSDNELQEFKDLIQRKLEAARKELVYLQGLITRRDEAGTDDTENKYMSVEDGGGTMEREQLSQLASRQIQYIDHLEKALVRIENKTYGICRETGKLIDKARLRAVPHATLSIEAKLAKKR